jgi:Flp pilus assembly pilin Flp
MMDLLCQSLVSLHADESAQGLAEYVLMVALVSLAATAGMNVLASGVNSALSTVGSIFTEYVS